MKEGRSQGNKIVVATLTRESGAYEEERDDANEVDDVQTVT